MHGRLPSAEQPTLLDRVGDVDDFSLAADLVREAGRLAARMLGEGLETHYKTSISDVVSAADLAAEELVVGRLAVARPGDGLVGEEGHARPGERTWYVDPVDGTYNFLSGIPYWCSAVGLVDAAGPVAGAVYYPAMDELWVGGRDYPTTLNGVPVVPLADRPLEAVSVATYFHPRHTQDPARAASWRAATNGSAAVRMLGSASVDLSGVASGRLGIFLQGNLSPWDWYPGAALVLGAGGVAEEVAMPGITWQVAGNSQAVADVVCALRGA
jgi:myo-inositol-1(or 4)-monophosphatase